jgi:hypothetical protein
MKERRGEGFKDLPISAPCEEICTVDVSSTRFGALDCGVVEVVGIVALQILEGRVRIGSLQQEQSVR